MTLKSLEQEDLQFLSEQGLWGGLLRSPRLMLCFHGCGLIQMFPTCGIFSLGGREPLAVKTDPSCAHLDLRGWVGGLFRLMSNPVLDSPALSPLRITSSPFTSPAPCRFAVPLSRSGSTSLFFWHHKMELVPKPWEEQEREFKNQISSQRTDSYQRNCEWDRTENDESQRGSGQPSFRSIL